MAPPPLTPVFSAQPTDRELTEARIFGEPLIPVGRVTLPEENHALAAVVKRYLDDRNPEAVLPFWGFLKQFPDSPWQASLLLNLGLVYRRTGYFSRALETWESAWSRTKTHSDARAKPLADRTVGELLELHARLGRFDRLEALLAEVEGRPILGRATEQITAAREGLWLMKNRPDQAFRCGPLAVDQILAATRVNYVRDQRIRDSKSTIQGTSLAQMQELAAQLDLPMQMAHRSPRSAVLLPALVHWRAGHFASLIREENGRYLVRDPTFGDEIWMSKAALDDEATGYLLVAPQALPDGWRRVDQAEGAQVWGKGHTDTNDPKRTRCQELAAAGCGMNCNPYAMAVHTVHLMVVSLSVRDTPVGYVPPRGPTMQFAVMYSQREAFQPSTPSFSHLGPKWTSDWISYIEDDPMNPSALAHLAARGGGRETFSGFNPATQEYQLEPLTRARLVRTSSSPIRYERRLPDGSVEVFAQPDGAAAMPRRVFMTEWRDAHGDSVTYTYDAQLRLVAATDALGQVTTLAYEDAADVRRITRVTDPFGRAATFQYDGMGRLQRITDVIGIQSSFAYDNGDFMVGLTTPYGMTRFSKGDNGRDRWIEIVDPMGGRERVEFRDTAPIPSSDPAPTVPSGPGITPTNNWLQHRNTFYWDKRAMAVAPRDLASAHIIHWLHTAGPLNQTSGTVESEKKPLEGRIWYQYPSQTSTNVEGTMHQPSVIARVLDDGTTQVWRKTYNALGKLISETDPLERRTSYVYAPNGIDVIEKRQTTSSMNDLLATYGNYTAQHLPQTQTDAAGQSIVYTYNAHGQILTETNARNETITYTYDPAGTGYLQSVSEATTGAIATHTRDAYGRIRTLTDFGGYTRTFDYDALDRVTRITHPDGTYEETVYDKLDPVQQRDRLGRITRRFYDALRRLVSTRDSLGRAITQQWCTCGSLDSFIDAKGQVTRWERDIRGRVVREIRADNLTQTVYTYEIRSNRLKTITDPNQQMTTYTYALDERLLSVAHTNGPATPGVSYTYDPNYDRLTSMSDGVGTTSYLYHPVGTLGAGRVAGVDGPLATDTITYAHDELGRVSTRTLGASVTTRTFDALERITTELTPLGTFTFGYDGASDRLASIQYPNGQTSVFTYFGATGDHRLQTLAHTRPGGATLATFQYTYDKAGNILTSRQHRGSDPPIEWQYAYDSTDQLTTAIKRSVGTPVVALARYAYTYDAAGNRVTEQIGDEATVSTYDPLNRLVAQQAGGGLRFVGHLNELGTVTLNGQPAAVSSANQFEGRVPTTTGTNLVTIVATDASGNASTARYEVDLTGSPRTFTYDANGNRTSDGTRTFEWDANSRLVRVCSGACAPATEVVSFAYDGLGRRRQKTTAAGVRSYVWDDLDVIEERMSGGGVTTRVPSPFLDHHLGAIEGGTATFVVADHLGSVSQVENSTGLVTTVARDYDPYGRPLAGAASPGYGFTGRDWDVESELYYYRARYYDASTGRFLNPDPIGLNGGANLYRYVLNNPMRFSDPMGLTTWECQRPMRGLGGDWKGIPHGFLWTDKCNKSYSFGPAFVSPSAPGHLKTDDNPFIDLKNKTLKPGVQCSVESTKECFDNCVCEKIAEAEKNPPWYYTGPTAGGQYMCWTARNAVISFCHATCR